MSSGHTWSGPSAAAGGPDRGADAREEREGEAPRFVIRDKRRIDPDTGNLRSRDQEVTMEDTPGASTPGGNPFGSGGDDTRLSPTSPTTGPASQNAARAAYADAPKGTTPSAPQPADDPKADEPQEDSATDGVEHPDTLLAAERLGDLQRLNAEYANYKRRVDRERALDKDRTVSGVIESMLPVLDEIHLARQHGELADGTPFAKIAAKLESVLAKYGVVAYGQPGEPFDPTVHEALMHTQAELPPGATDTTVVQVMQPGYRLGERVVRPALVAVADPS